MESTQAGLMLRYLLVGAVATATHFLVLAALVEILFVAPAIAAWAGALMGALIAYVGNHRFTFSSDLEHRDALPRFLLMALLSSLLNGLFVWSIISLSTLHYLAAQTIATGIVVLVSFYFSQQWIFHSPK